MLLDVLEISQQSEGHHLLNHYHRLSLSVCDNKSKDRYFWINISILSLVCMTTLIIIFCKLISWIRSSPKSQSDQSVRLDRNIKQFQTYISQQTSVIIPSDSLEQSLRNVPQHNIPDVVECIEVFPHRKMFLGQVEWKYKGGLSYVGFIKECMNPLEMQLHRRLQHENVVQFYWSNLADRPKIVVAEGATTRSLPISFYCMEYCRGTSLNSFLVYQGHTMHTEEILGLIRDIVSGVQYLHRNGIAHRDLKSDNILVQHNIRKECKAKISDFDHAIDTKNNYELKIGVEQGRNGFGSPLYTAPEFILETIKEPGGEDFIKHDVYSLGLVIWECVTWVKCKHNNYNILMERGFHGNTSITAPLLPREANDLNHTNDIGQYRSLVKCSSTVHVPLIKQICKTLNLKYCKNEKVLHKNGLFLKKDRLIDSNLMIEFYSKNEEARPVFFRENIQPLYTKKINQILEGCWSNEPHQRYTADDILGMLTDHIIN